MPKELLKVSTNLRGKMTGMTVITSACVDNPNCKKLAKIGENSKKMAIIDANERIYSVVKNILGFV